MSSSGTERSVVVDVHSHFFPEDFLELIESLGPPRQAGVDRGGEVRTLSMPGHPPVALTPQFVDVRARLAHLDVRRIDMQALSLSPPMVYWAPTDLGVALARAHNNGIAAICRRHPTRFLGLATVPLQDVPSALTEMRRAISDLGMRGVYLGTSVQGHYIDEPQFRPIWELSEQLGIPVFTHPHTHLGAEELHEFHLFNTVGYPTETAVLVARLIYSGVFDAWPNVRVVLAHAGGTIPMLLGRLDHAYRQRVHLQKAVAQPPSAYVDHFVFDTITHSDRALRFVVDMVGTERMVLGTDAPYDMADDDPVTRVQRLGLAPEQEDALLGTTAVRLLNLPVTRVVTKR